VTAQGYTGPSVSITDVSGLTAALAAKLATTAPEIVDTTFLVRKGDNSAGLRYRATGSAVDVEKSSGDIIESSWSGALPGAGVQTNLRRWRGDGNTFVGRTEFGTGAFASEMAIDASGGYAKLGGKNGLTALNFCGRKGTAGAPTTGTWALNDWVIDSANTNHVCTIAGTPGTWT
jgi:hypothetical protein